MYVRDDFLVHYGTKFHSGRYPYGSGENPYQHDAKAFKARIAELRDKGLSDTKIAAYFGIKTTELRPLIAMATHEERAFKIEQAEKLLEKYHNISEVGRRMGISDTSVHALLDEKAKARTYAAKNAAAFLKDQVDSKGLIDVGKGVERELNITRQKMDEAIAVLKNEGYVVYNGSQAQVTNKDQRTHTQVLCPPGTEYKQIYNEPVNSVVDYIFHDDTKPPEKAFKFPESMDSKRLMVRYAEEGGIDKDGLIEIRPGLKDLSLGESKYAQVRIAVDGTHYLKGMAAYNSNLPDGVDVVFNTNKPKGTPALGPKNHTVLKLLKKDKDGNIDRDNPFGSALKEHGGQSEYEGDDGKQHLSLINKCREEGDWAQWSKELPSQFLAKQNIQLINRQLNLTISEKEDEFNQLRNLNQPNVKYSLLMDFADQCDAQAVTLKSAALPNQVYKVILPAPTLKDNECYAPDLKNGTEVSLVRFPHGGTFEIPKLIVNNNNKEAAEMYGNAYDGIAISKNTADRLSGADFDGDTVLRIPTTNKVKISNRDQLKDLEGFDPKIQYPEVPGMKIMSNTQNQMGVISNLITDMTVKGAPDDEIAMAVKHSMVVIDAEKHHLNYKQSEIDNHIKQLKDKWQGHTDEETGNWVHGASTLLSRAKNETSVAKRKGSPYIDRETGELIYKTDSDRFYTDKKTGKMKERRTKVTQMEAIKDARALSSGTDVEDAYANYANTLKNIANRARQEAVHIKGVERIPSATEAYAKEVKELDDALARAELNKPREREAQRLADTTIKAQLADNPNMTKEEKSKCRDLALKNARLAVGAKGQKITLTDKQWEAIQSNAFTRSKLNEIFTYVDKDDLRKRATPKQVQGVALTDTQIGRIRAMINSGYKSADIAEVMGVSTSTVNKYAKGG